MKSVKLPASPNSGSLRVRLSHAIGLRSMDSNGYPDLSLIHISEPTRPY